MSKEMVDAQLAENLAKYSDSEENQRNLDLVRRIATLYEEKGELQHALEWFDYTGSLLNNTDPAVARKSSEIRLKILDQSIAEYQMWLEQYGSSEEADEARKTLEKLKADRSRQRNPPDSLL